MLFRRKEASAFMRISFGQWIAKARILVAGLVNMKLARCSPQGCSNLVSGTRSSKLKERLENTSLLRRDETLPLLMRIKLLGSLLRKGFVNTNVVRLAGAKRARFASFTLTNVFARLRPMSTRAD